MDHYDPAIQELFFAALDIESPQERAAYLDGACDSDPALRSRIEHLLEAHEQAGNFLGGAPSADDGTLHYAPIEEHPGTKLGPYTLREQIGEGGFGVVFIAEQTTPVRRQVALKIIKPGMDSRQVIARFEAERQALAMMDHANIARVFDAGATESGRPYFVMELVRGIPIIEYCDRCHLTTRERLELLVTVCQTVQHAHQKGVIHRDLKPSNVLVEMKDGRPAPKIIDFGVAKSLSQRLTERTLATAFADMVGTPLYMSPEQAEMSPLGVDTRTDIYSLGVLLYELLTGATPIEKGRLKSLSYDQLRRVIREEEPPKPSTRISTLDPKSASTLAERCRTNPQRLLQTVRGELDWIVMKCLDKDRNRRYETANGLARDLERYLHDEPVEACPPSVAYRVHKFVRRNRTAVIAAGVILLCLVGGMVGTTYGLLRARHERDAAEIARDEAEQAREAETEQRREAQAVTEFLVEALESPDPSRKGHEVTVVEVLDQAETELETKLADQPLTRAALLKAIGRSRLMLGLYSRAVDPLTKALKLRQEILGFDHPDSLALQQMLAHTLAQAGDRDEAIRNYEEILIARRESLGPDHPDTLKAMSRLGYTYDLTGQSERAIDIISQALAVQRTNLGEDHVNTLASMVLLGHAYRHTGRFEEALRLYEEAVACYRKENGSIHRTTLNAMNSLAYAYWGAGRLDDAIELFKKTLAGRQLLLGKTHPDTLNTMAGLTETYHHAGRSDECERLLANFPPAGAARISNTMAWHLATSSMPQLRDGNRAVELATRACELTDYKNASYVDTLAAAYAAVGEFEAAVKWSKKSLELLGDSGQSSLRKELSRALAKYQAGVPFWQELPPGGDQQLDDEASPGTSEENTQIAKASSADGDSTEQDPTVGAPESAQE